MLRENYYLFLMHVSHLIILQMNVKMVYYNRSMYKINAQQIYIKHIIELLLFNN